MKHIRAETFALRSAAKHSQLRSEVKRPRRKNPEQAFQISLVRDLARLLPGDCLMTAFPAGGGGKVRGGILKAMGLVAGVPDLLFIHRGECFFMELKAAKGKLTEAQVETHAKIASCGVDIRVIRTLDQALAALGEWEIPLRCVGEWQKRRTE